MKVKMKKKKINKISKKIFDQISENYTISQKKKPVNESKYYGAVEPTPMVEEEYICEYDEEISIKFKKLFNNIIKYPENIKLTHTISYINIEIANIKYIKKSPTPSNNGTIKLSSGEEQLSIYIFKDKCFTITQGYSKQTKYVDVNMYNELIDITKDKVKEINANNFNIIWENISRESGILRDSNLDEILSNVDGN